MDGYNVLNCKLGFLAPDLTFTECGYGEHTVYMFRLLKKLKKETEYLSVFKAQEVIENYGILRIARASILNDYLSVSCPSNISQKQFDWLVENYLDAMNIDAFNTSRGFGKMGIKILENSKIDKNSELYECIEYMIKFNNENKHKEDKNGQ